MTPDKWALIRNFTPQENWGDPEKIDYNLVLELDHFRDFIKTPIHILCGTQGAHAEGSKHYDGEAVDICFPDVPLDGLFDLWIASQRFIGFRGIGLYPHWKAPDGVVRGGLHLDTRGGNRALWMGVQGATGQTYVGLTVQNLKQYGLV